MGLIDTCTITVNGVERSYKKAFVAKYAKDLAKGNSAVAKCDVSGGTSILRVSHDQSSNQQRHLISIEDEVLGSDGVVRTTKAHTVITCESNNPSEEAKSEQLLVGLNGKLQEAGFITSIVDGEL